MREEGTSGGHEGEMNNEVMSRQRRAESHLAGIRGINNNVESIVECLFRCIKKKKDNDRDGRSLASVYIIVGGSELTTTRTV